MNFDDWLKVLVNIAATYRKKLIFIVRARVITHVKLVTLQKVEDRLLEAPGFNSQIFFLRGIKAIRIAVLRRIEGNFAPYTPMKELSADLVKLGSLTRKACNFSAHQS